MFGTVLEKIGGLLSRSFVLANFFPLVIFAAASVAVAWIGLPDARPTLIAIFELDAGKQALVFAAGLIAIAVVAYVVSPLTVVVRRILEGDLLVPGRLRTLMEAEQKEIADRLKNQRDEANAKDDEASDIYKQCLRDLMEARRVGDRLNALGPQALLQVTAAERLLEQAKRRLAHDDDTAIEDLRRAIEATITALRNNSTVLPAAASREDRALAHRVGVCQAQATSLLRQLADDARQALINSQDALRGRFARKGIWPTRIANIRAAAESHGLDAYGIEFDFLWPRLKLAVQKDDKIATLIETAKTQVDFSLLMVLLCGLFTAGWIIALVWLDGSPLVVIVLGVSGQWMIFFFLRVVEESVKQLGELLSGTVDFYRFKLLREMDIDLPGSLAAERALWQRLQQSSTTALGTIDIAYRHNKP